LFSDFVEHGAVRLLLRSRCLLVLFCLLAASVANPGLSPCAASEDKPESKDASVYKIVFQGNVALNESVLRRDAAVELEAFEKEGHRPADIDDAAFQMQLAYRKAGYAFAAVDYHIETREAVTTVTFQISEGPRVIISDIRPVGNKAFRDEVLRSYFEKDRTGIFNRGELLFVRADVAAAVDEIRDRYMTHGYLDAVVEEPHLQFNADRSRVDITIKIIEGVHYTVHRIDFHGDVLPQVQTELDKLRQDMIGRPYFNRQKLILQSGILETYGNSGYPDASVEIERGSTAEPGQVELDAFITSGQLITIAGVEIRGNQRTRTSFIRDRIPLKAGDRYSLALQKQSFRDLYRTGIFSKVDFNLEKTDKPGQRILVVTVKETLAKEVFFEPGWGSYEKLRLRVGFQEKNLFGTGRIFRTQATGSVKAQSLGGGLSDPFFLNTDIKADLTAFFNHREEPSFTRRDIGITFALSKYLTDNLLSSAAYMIRKTDITNVDPVEDQSEGNYNFASIKGQVTYDTRNDIFFPTTGQRLFAAAEQAAGLLGSGINLTRLTGGARVFYHLAANTVLGARYSTGLVLPGPGQVTLPLAERFFNGGENTVRSYKESELGPKDSSGDPVGGYGFNVINLELRQRLVGNLIGTMFFDYGNIAPNRSREEQGRPSYDSRSEVTKDTLDDFFKGFRPGLGVGLQYLLPVGPARFDVAFNPDRDSERDEDAYVFHFSVGTAF